MAENPIYQGKRFIGTREQCKSFLDRQPTQLNKTWVCRDLLTGQRVYLT